MINDRVKRDYLQRFTQSNIYIAYKFTPMVYFTACKNN